MITVITSLIWVPRTVSKDGQKTSYLEVSQIFRTVAKAHFFLPEQSKKFSERGTDSCLLREEKPPRGSKTTPPPCCYLPGHKFMFYSGDI